MQQRKAAARLRERGDVRSSLLVADVTVARTVAATVLSPDRDCGFPPTPL